MDTRRKVFDDDWTGTEFAFAVASIKTLDGFCPLDKIAVGFCGGEGKELKDGIGELTDAKMAEDKAKELTKTIFTAMETFYNDLVSDYKDGTKEGEVMGKYTGTEAIAQMDACLKAFSENCGDEELKWPKAAEAKEGEMEMMGMDMMMAEGEMEGGEMMEGEMMAAAEEAPAAPSKRMSIIAADAFGEAKGPADLPKLLCSLMFYHPVFGDAVKAQTMHWELGGDKFKDFAAVATIVGAYVNAGEKADKPSFGVAYLTEEDLEELKEVSAAKTDQALVFPGIVGAWADEETAMGQCDKVDGKTKVLFKFNGKAMTPAGDKLVVFCRQFAKLESLEEKPAEGKDFLVCELSDFTDHVYATTAEYTEAVKKAAEAAAAAASEVKDATMMEEKPEDMMDMMMMEGEGM